MNNLFSKAPLGFLLIFLCEPSFAQEWVKPAAGRSEYVQDRIACAQEAQSMALAGEAFNRDVAECLVSKGWRHSLSDRRMAMYCADRPLAISCKPGGTDEMYKKDRAECFERMMKTVGNTYSRPGWSGLGGLIVSSIQAEENKTNLQKAQLLTMKICLEGKNWPVELKGETKAVTSYVERDDLPASPAAATQAPSLTIAAPSRSLDEVGRTTNHVQAPEPLPPAKMGKFTFEVEKLAKSEQCSSTPIAALTASGPGFENYSVPCPNGEALAVRCDLGNCRTLK